MKRLLTKFFRAPAANNLEIVHTDTPPLEGAALSIAYFSPRSGGDFHAFLRVSPIRFVFGLLDVAGKRETSEKILQAARACFCAGAEDLFSAEEVNESEAMIELARRLNLEIMRAAGGGLLQRGARHGLLCQCGAHTGLVAR